MPKTITVFGATGHQGGAIARALARDPANFVVRGITRDVQQEVKVDDLKNCGVAVIQCNLDDVNSIKMALNDADGCFVVTYTDYNEPDCIAKEIQQGKNIADACALANIPHVIYSTQLHTTRVKGIEVRNLVAKAEVEEYFRSKGLPLSCFLVPCYYENFYDFLKPRRVDRNNFVFEIPMGEMPLDLVSVEDIGEVARTVFLNRSAYLDKTLSLCGEKITIKELAADFSRALAPLTFRDKPITVHDYKKRGEPWSVDFGNMFEFFVRKDQRYQLQHTKDIHPGVQSFREWVARNARTLGDCFNKL
ncbi:NMRL1-like protein [Mya arenaria]|nr:nmrA-like family domain-containing protein 1 isoform X2 [Mya arenaria]XP_052790461.1 nmrA-like family domain-containing protein 1 isoform X2 [Mya arenaria]WAR31235.1 NMRL1-like protein [Mya arenaria]